ncbi:MAG: hypothetical protein B7X41_00375, partial [Microbacterium sp. 14-71-5]
MTAPKEIPMPDTLADDVRAPIESAIAELQKGSAAWSSLTVGQRVTLLRGVRRTVAANARAWARA